MIRRLAAPYRARERKLLAYIVDHGERHDGQFPSPQQMARALGVAVPSARLTLKALARVKNISPAIVNQTQLPRVTR